MGDFYTDSAQRRFAQIEADRAQALADLQQAKTSDDSFLAAESVQRIADLDAAARNLVDLHLRYSQSQNPPPAPEISKEQRAAKNWSEMSYDDALQLARTSKYASDLTHDDPHVRAGYAEVARRKARGE
jgi:hypothetical protein